MLSRITPATPTICPVSLDMLRRHASITHTFDDDLLQLYGTLATEMAEHATNRFFLQRSVSWVLTADTRQTVYFSMAVTLQNFFNTYQRPWIHLPHSAVSVESFAVGNWGVADVPLVSGRDYNVDLQSDPCRIEMLNFVEFDPNVDHLTVSYTSGYGTRAADVPPPIIGAILMLATRLREQRGDQDSNIWECGAAHLLAPYTVLHFGGFSDLFNS